MIHYTGLARTCLHSHRRCCCRRRRHCRCCCCSQVSPESIMEQMSTMTKNYGIKAVGRAAAATLMLPLAVGVDLIILPGPQVSLRCAVPCCAVVVGRVLAMLCLSVAALPRLTWMMVCWSCRCSHTTRPGTSTATPMEQVGSRDKYTWVPPGWHMFWVVQLASSTTQPSELVLPGPAQQAAVAAQQQRRCCVAVMHAVRADPFPLCMCCCVLALCCRVCPALPDVYWLQWVPQG